MVKKTFHKQEFDDGTALKLEIFQGYVREWISVFLTDSSKLGHITSVNIFDFFAGPGGDAASNPGSPLIIQNEIKRYCIEHSSIKNNKPITIYFNDKEAEKIETLKLNIAKNQCGKGCCESRFMSELFSDALEILLPVIEHPGSANLVIMDQFGISDVTPEVVQRLAKCTCTDILFFFPSSFLKRFQEHQSFKSKYDLSGKDLDYKTIHRAICNHFREKLGSTRYYLAPFSIQKNVSIHGVIFGSSNLLGLEKFLNVCWKLDPETGEANFNMEGDPFWGTEHTLFDEVKSFKKIDQFKADLIRFVQDKRPDNIGMYAFCLENGFPPSKANQSLKDLVESGQISTTLPNGQKARKGAFYLNHSERTSRIKFHKGKGTP